MGSDRHWRSLRRFRVVGPLIAVAVSAGILVNLSHQSELVEALALAVVVLGMSTLGLWPILRVLALLGEVPTLAASRTLEGREGGLARLNRWAAEHKELVDALGKLVVPVLVALVGLFGVVLTLVALD